MIERLAVLPKGQPQALILAPTRELALQIFDSIEKLGRSHRISATVIVGGSDMQAQIRGLRQRPDILVATPGRLLDHMWNGTVNLAPMKILVLDEADRMLDMGFAPQINQILDALPVERQTLLFSATLPTDVTRLVQASLNSAVHVMVTPSSTTADGVTQALYHTTSQEGLSSYLLGQKVGSIDSGRRLNGPGIVSRSSMETEVCLSVSVLLTDLNEGKSEFSLRRILLPEELMWRTSATW
jgi:ATP-dependent RNA helicase RhlE